MCLSQIMFSCTDTNQHMFNSIERFWGNDLTICIYANLGVATGGHDVGTSDSNGP
jgi:hypothetical protein